MAIALLCLGGAARAADPLEDLKKTLKSNEPGGVDLGALRGLTGFSQDEEIAIGRQAAGNILGAAPLVKDPALQRYVNRVARWIASQERASRTSLASTPASSLSVRKPR